MPQEIADQRSLLDDIIDDTEGDEAVAIEKYAISSFGIDFDVEGLIRRLRREEIYVPHFQRNFVWKQKEASQFIESLLLGLPVPGVFLAKDRESERLMIIDGQQRLKSLQFFYDGFFRPDDDPKRKKVFSLTEVQPQYRDRRYEDLAQDDQRRLDNAVIHSTIIKQESPKEEEDTSLYYVFGRLNTGGRKLSPQEIRAAIYHGPFSNLIEELNEFAPWRALFGKPNDRLKDQELIVRFLALYSGLKYFRPMEEYLNQFVKRNQKIEGETLTTLKNVFEDAMSTAHRYLGEAAFRPVRSFNAAWFDSVAVGLAERLREKGPITDGEGLKTAHRSLLTNEKFVAATERATSDESSVADRIDAAIQAFKNVK
jgi:hypothetical protein